LARQPPPFSSSRGPFLFTHAHTHTRVHPSARGFAPRRGRGGRTPSQVGWGLPRADAVEEQSEGLAAAQPWHSLPSPFDYFFLVFSPPPLHFISSLPSLSPLSGKALPAGEGWEGRESLGRQQIKSAEEERKEFRGGQRPWDVQHRRSPSGTLPKVSPCVSHPGAGSPPALLRLSSRETSHWRWCGPQGPSPRASLVALEGALLPCRGLAPHNTLPSPGEVVFGGERLSSAASHGKSHPISSRLGWDGCGEPRGCCGCRAGGGNQGISASPWIRGNPGYPSPVAVGGLGYAWGRAARHPQRVLF